MKKLISIILALTMLLGMSLNVSAEDNTASGSDTAVQSKSESKLKEAILTAKKRVDLPKRFNKFEYEEVTEYGSTYYQLKWACIGKKCKEYSEVDDSYFKIENYEYDSYYYERVETITVVIKSNEILYYDYYDSNYASQGKKRFAKLSVDKQLSYAKKYMSQLNPDTKGNPIITRDTSSISLTSNEISYSISRKNSGIDLTENYGTIVINRDTGVLLKYGLTWWNDAAFPDASKAISEEEVQEIYAERKGLEAFYQIVYDDKKESYRSFVVYTPKNYGENLIDAITGEYTKMYDDIEHYQKTSSYNWSGYGDDYVVDACAGESQEGETLEEDEAYLSEAEQEELKKEDSLISKSEATDIIKKDKYIVLNNNLIQSSAYLSTYYDDKNEIHYCWKLTYEFSSDNDTEDDIYLNVDMDAETGRILYIDKSYAYKENSKTKNTTKIDENKAKKLADEAASYYLGDKFSEYKYISVSDKEYNDIERTFSYTRYINNLPVTADTVTISVDSRNEVLYFSYVYHDIEFPDAKILSVEKAYEKLFKKMNPSLYYTGFSDLQNKSHIYLTYEFDAYYYIDAKTGKRIDEYGSPYYSDYKQEKDKEIKYTDIQGHWAEKYINTLLAYDIHISDESELKPDEAITVGEFYGLVNDLFGNGEELIYIENYDAPLTRAELAKCFTIMYTDCDEAAEIPDIFKSPYPDVADTSNYCGYIAIAQSKGYISIKKGENFCPNKTISKAEALKLAYEYLSKENDLKLYELYKI